MSSDTLHPPGPPPLPNQPIVYAYPPAPRGRGCGVIILGIVLAISLVLNVLLCAGYTLVELTSLTPQLDVGLPEKHYSGNAQASDKIAIVKVDVPITESYLGYAYRQIDQAARDDSVKAVVLRVDSPGGSITASDNLLRRLEQMRDATTPKYKGQSIRKPLVVSMGGICASGGYYISMAAAQTPGDPKPAPKLFAERTTITGSIGVYASLPNMKEMADKVGFKMELIKAGDIKASGSPFHVFTAQERQPWQDMVDSAFRQFVGVVETGRPKLKDKMTEPLGPPKKLAKFDDKGNVLAQDGGETVRRRADGGIFTAKEAVDNGLIDSIGFLDDVIVEAASQAGISDYHVVEYVRPHSIWSAIVGAQASAPNGLDLSKQIDLTPKLWYLLPHAEVGARIKPNVEQ